MLVVAIFGVFWLCSFCVHDVFVCEDGVESRNGLGLGVETGWLKDMKSGII